MLVVGCACAALPPRFAESLPAAIRETGLRAVEDPTVHGARLFPERLDEAIGWGVEPGGGARSIVEGVRVVSLSNGGMVVARDRLPSTPSSVVALPERLGGGFLFGIGPHLWRAATWLGTANGIFTSSTPVAQIFVGLDRVYARSPHGGLVGLDPRTGVSMGWGPLPASPRIGRLAALDGWRAVAIVDLRGALLTHDAGSTWQPIALPIEPTDIVALKDSIAIGGPGERNQLEWWDVMSDGQTSRLASTIPRSGGPPEGAQNAIDPNGALADLRQDVDPTVNAFGPRPLASAIEDGWPMTDGTALVARDGAIARVRLTDGALVESVAHAFPLKPARCHAIALAHARDPGAVGFVCGEPRGRTVVYRWDAPRGRLMGLRRFENPRAVLGFSNGALAVRGPCACDAIDESAGAERPWCVMPPGAPWKEMRLPNDARVVVLSDGRVELVRPPRGGDLSTARLTATDGARGSDIPIALPPMHPDVAHALREGIWLDGFEERRPGVIGGWVDAAGSILGIEIAANGEARVGEYIRDAGAPVASGRWAFGWTASRRGFETTDGGMTWAKEISLPDPIASGRAIHERVCGPIGCIAAGWLRVGWGSTGAEPSVELPPRRFPPARPAPNLDLDCEPTGGLILEPTPTAIRSSLANAGATWSANSASPPFAGRPGPAIPVPDLGLSVESSGSLDRTLHDVPMARIYAWGPKTGDWDQLGRWDVRWQWPWGGRSDARSSTTARDPWTNLDIGRRALGIVPGSATVWSFAEGDDPDHALLIARHAPGTTTAELYMLETDRPPVEARPSSGELFADIYGAARMGGRWYLATAQAAGELAATVLWSLDGATGRELARVPRAGFDVRPALRLARHTDGRAVGLVVDGELDEMRGTAWRWVAGIDVDSYAVATPEPLAPADLSDRTVSSCAGDDAGWEVDLPYPGRVRLRIGTDWQASLDGPVARMRLSRERACVEGVLGRIDALGAAPPDTRTTSTPSLRPAAVRTIRAGVIAARSRYALQCQARSWQM